MLVIERQDFRKTERELVNSCRGYRFSIVSFPKETPAGARDEMFKVAPALPVRRQTARGDYRALRC